MNSTSDVTAKAGTGRGAAATSVAMRLLRAALLVPLLCAVPLACGGDEEGAGQLVGYTASPPTDVGGLSLPDASTAQPVSFTPAAGHLKVVYFGYTSCPDVCPTTLADLKAGLAKLQTKAERIEVAMVTVDPERDTAETLPAYVRSFIPNAQALRSADAKALADVAARFGASYSVTKGADGKVEVEHSAAMYVVNAKGQVVDVLSFPTAAKDIANDLGLLLRSSS